ncbi:MAG TPA: beta-propeller domain-containing protein [Nitrosarchaeum sp.]|nr:beta-propeller domain-containing protein [Nitrosarchaeum sp.]
MNNKILAGIITGIIVIGITAFYFTLNTESEKSEPIPVGENTSEENSPSILEEKEGLIKFTSYDEIKEFLKDNQSQQYGFDELVRRDGGLIRERVPMPTVSEPIPESMPTPDAAPSGDGNTNTDFDYPEFSSTNVQVKNVDEPDYIKTDGKYIYIVNQNWLTIIDAHPADNAKIILKTALDIEQQNLENMFLNGDKLVIFYYGSGQTYGIAQYDYAPYPIYTPKTFSTILDVSDRVNPKIVTKYEVDGSYVNSRMINDVIYLVTSSGVDYVNPILPRIMEGSTLIMPDVYRFPNPEPSYTFNTVTAFDVSGKLYASETFLMGYSNTIYVSEENLYITYQKNIPYTYYDNMSKDRFFDVIVPLLPQDVQDKIKIIQNDAKLDPYAKWIQVSNLLQDTYNNLPKDEKEKLFEQIQSALEEYDARIQSDVSRTVIHKIGLDKGNFKYVANSEVPGYLLNQFSMDESGNRFRIATTSESFSRSGSAPSSNVFVLDENLNLVGSLTKIAPDERIYSARFMDDKLFLVTFKQIDPFFVIDLSTDSPKILGALKIPGFSNYLQPYDEDHIIGIGKDTKENEWGGMSTTGVKISMFDVSDFQNPKETDTIVIGDSSTDSEALYNHKSLLLDKQQGVMSLPIKGELKAIFDDAKTDSQYVQWNGFFVYGFDKDGFVKKGSISHYTGNNYNSIYMPARSLYIDDVLYTVMDGSIKMNDLTNISNEINSITIGSTGGLISYLDK